MSGEHHPEWVIDPETPSVARMYDYYLGGKDNFAADRKAADQVVAAMPNVLEFTRAVRFLAGEAHLRQFLDIGTGLPTVENTHEVAQRVAPESRVVYVDNDPIVLAHARALLLSSAEGSTTYIDADLFDTPRILEVAAQSLDFTRPIALMLMNILGHVPDFERAREIVGGLVAALPPGSYLVVADGTTDGGPFDAAIEMWNQAGSLPYTLRTPEEIAQYFDGLELLEPGVVACPLWRPDALDLGVAVAVDEFGAVGRNG